MSRLGLERLRQGRTIRWICRDAGGGVVSGEGGGVFGGAGGGVVSGTGGGVVGSDYTIYNDIT